jgi:hypothetical protein
MATTDGTSAEYRYFTTDLLSNIVLAEIPFRGVSFERSIKAAGSFSGTIPVIPDTASMDLYDSTMPGKTALYIVRDQECVWGGIIWSRSYDVLERSLSVNASEFTSYFHHRNIWQTFSHDFGANVVVSSGTATVTLQNSEYAFPVNSSIRLVFAPTEMYEYNGYYTVATANGTDQFTISTSVIPSGTYIDVTVYVRVDTYDYVRQLVDEVLSDFSGTTFANIEIEPALRNDIAITNKALTSNVATITTSTPHGIIPTQTVDIFNVDSTFNGGHDVVSTPTATTFTANITSATNVASTAVSANAKTITHKEIKDFIGTITTSAAHGFSIGDTVLVSGVDGSDVTVTNKALTGNVATITTAAVHGANIGDIITVRGVDATFNGVYTVENVPSTTTIKYLKEAANVPSAAVSPVGSVVVQVPAVVFDTYHTIVKTPTATTFTFDLADTDMPITAVPGDGVVGLSGISTKSVVAATTANIATTGYYTNTGYFSQYISSVLVTSSTSAPVIDGVTLSEGDRVLIKDQTTPAHNGIYTYQRIVRHINGSYNDTQESAGYTGTYNAGRRLGQGTFYWNVNDSITVNGATNPISSVLIGTNFGSYPYLQSISSEVWTGFIRATDSDTMAEIAGTIVVSSSGTLNGRRVFSNTNSLTDVVGTTAISYSRRGATATRTPTVSVGTYGPFPGNSDIDIYFSTDAYSGNKIPNTLYRGFELKNVGEALDEYSDTVKGFEYRIDCHLEYVGVVPVFTREFVLISIDFPNPPVAGEVSPISRFGADNLVFEYPGSIISMTMDESAEDSATRFFVVGNSGGLGEDVSEPYAVASATDLLAAGWPLIDQEETRNDVADETKLYEHAERYLAEMRTPISDITVTVNGSFSPKLGEYAPGDWCSIIVNDEFVRMRLASDLEPRDTVIVRKIDGFKVRVPDAPSFPEEVELILVTEPQVDAIG